MTTSKASSLKAKKTPHKSRKQSRISKMQEKPHCQLCLAEKMIILQAGKKNLLNKRSEIGSKYRLRNKFRLKNVRLKA